jgi:hypothetical protein
VEHGLMIDEVDCGQDAILEFLLGCDTDVAQYRAGELGEEAFDDLRPTICTTGDWESTTTD